MRVWASGLGLLAIVAVALPLRAFADAPCKVEPALDDAAAALLSENAPLTGDGLKLAARRAGSAAVRVHGLRLPSANAAREAEWFAGKAAEAGVPVVCGRADEEGRVVLVLAERAGDLERDPTHDRRFKVKLVPGFRKPVLVVSDAEGDLTHITPTTPREWIVIPDDVLPPFVVQLVAEDANGPRPLAERAVGGEPPAKRSTRIVREEGISDRDFARDWLRAHRAARAVPALRVNPALDAAASAHAANVCKEGRARHSLGSGDPEARLRSNGIVARHVGEAVARASSVEAAVASLEGSASHDAAILDARFTDVGVGVATDTAAHSCVTLLFAAWPRVVPVSAKP
jgi:hypothetical protein